MPTARRAVVLKYLCLTVAVLAALEGLAWLATIPLRRLGLFYDPSGITQSFDVHGSPRDAMLGWAPRPGMPDIDENGARAVPEDARFDRICISLFGDDFTWAPHVDDGEAWGALLARRLGCGVANFGVSGYGTDQAYLRYLERPKRGGIAVLDHATGSVLRNVNQFGNLIDPGTALALKPRFVESGDGPVLIPVPRIASDGLGTFLAAPSSRLAQEHFLPGTADGPPEVKFPHFWSVVRAVWKSRRVRADLTGQPGYTAFYAPDHPSRSLAVTERIFAEFAATSRANGQIPVVTIIPTCRELRHAQKTGRWTYAPLIADIRGENYLLLDFGPELLRRLDGAAADTIYGRDPGDCSAPFNARGQEILTEIALAFLWKQEATRTYLSGLGL